MSQSVGHRFRPLFPILKLEEALVLAPLDPVVTVIVRLSLDVAWVKLLTACEATAGFLTMNDRDAGRPQHHVHDGTLRLSDIIRNVRRFVVYTACFETMRS